MILTRAVNAADTQLANAPDGVTTDLLKLTAETELVAADATNGVTQVIKTTTHQIEFNSYAYSLETIDAYVKEGVDATLEVKVNNFHSSNGDISMTNPVWTLESRTEISAGMTQYKPSYSSPTYKLAIAKGSGATITPQKYTLTFNIVKSTTTTLQTLTDVVLYDTYTIATSSVENKDSVDAELTCTVTAGTVGTWTAANYKYVWVGPNGAEADKDGTYDDLTVTQAANSLESVLKVDSSIIDGNKGTDDTYTCKVQYGDYTSDEATVDLKAYTSGFTSVEAQSGKAATLTCTVAGKSADNAATTVWKLGSTTLTNDANYAITANTASDPFPTTLEIKAGVTTTTTFTCEITVDGVMGSEEPQVTVFDITTSEKPVQLNNEAVLTCSITSLDALTTVVAWSSDSQNSYPVDGFTPKTTAIANNAQQSTLTIRSDKVVSGVDSAYTCSVTVGGVAYTEVINLRTFTSSWSTEEVQTGTQAVLTCELTGVPTGSVAGLKARWRKGAAVYYSAARGGTDPQFVVTDPADVSGKQQTTLTVGGARVTEDAVYECIWSVEEADFLTDVNMKTFKITPVSTEAQEGRVATLSCVLSDMTISAATIVWFKGTTSGDQYTAAAGKFGNTVSEGTYDSATGMQTTTLTISETETAKGESDYICQATYGGSNGLFSATAKLDTFTVVTTTKEVKIGYAATLTCTIDSLDVDSTETQWSEGNNLYTKTNSATGFAVTESGIVNGKQVTTLVVDKSLVSVDKTFTCNVAVNQPKEWFTTEVEMLVFDVVASTKEVRVGYKATLTCTLSGLSSVTTTIKWKMDTTVWSAIDNANHADYYISDGAPSAGGQTTTLTIAADKVKQDEIYTCVVIIHKGSGEEFPTESPLKTFTITPSGPEVQKGYKAMLTCTISDIQASSVDISWTDSSTTFASNVANSAYTVTDGSISANKQTTTLEIATSGSDKMYTCKVTVSGETFLHSVQLLTFDNTPSSREVRNGYTATLSCTFSDLTHQPSAIVWKNPAGNTEYKAVNNDEAAQASFKVADGVFNPTTKVQITTLTVDKSQVTSDVDYTCQVSVDGAVFEKKVPLKTFTITGSSKQVQSAAAATLTCLAEGMQATTTHIEWGDESVRYSTDQSEPNSLCQNANGTDYRGTKATTKSGKACKLWTVQNEYTEANYPGQGITNNYCRNPINPTTKTAWYSPFCYTNDQGTEWEDCDLPKCGFKVTDGTPQNPSAGQQSTELKIDGTYTTGDRVYTCKYTVEGEMFTQVVDLWTFFSTPSHVAEVEVGTSAELSCSFTNMNAGTSFSIEWTGPKSSASPGTYSVATNSDPGYTVAIGALNSQGTASTSLSIKQASLITKDDMYTCSITVEGEKFSSEVELRTFVITHDSADVKHGVNAVLTCQLTGLTVSSVGIKWGMTMNGVDHEWTSADNSAGYTVSDGSVDSNGALTTTLDIGGQHTGMDMDYTCKVTVDKKEYDHVVDSKIFDLTVRGTEVKEGTVATLTCTVRWASVAPEALTWSVEGQGIYSSANDTSSGHVVTYNKGSFSNGLVQSTIVTASPQDDRYYTCNVLYAGRIYSERTTLMIFGITTQNDAYYAGETATLTCRVSDYTTLISSAQVKWSTNGIDATTGVAWDSDKTTLTLTNVQQDAEYTCYIMVDNKWHTKRMTLDVFDLEAVDDLATSSTQASPLCKVHDLSLSESVKVTWKDQNGGAMSSGLSTSNGGRNTDTLTVSVTGDRTYTCYLTIGLAFGDKVFSKTVFVDHVDISHPNVVQSADSNTQLVCTTSGVDSLTSAYSWNKPSSTNNAFITTKLTQLTKSQVLVANIDNTKTSPEGKWQCNFEYMRSQRQNIKRTLSEGLWMDQAEITTTLKPAYVNTDSDATFTCKGRDTSAGQNLAPTYAWFVNGNLVKSTSAFAFNIASSSSKASVLTIKALFSLDGATVKCDVIYQSSNSLTLSTSNMLYSHYISTSPAPVGKDVYAFEGVPLELTCVYNTLYKTGLSIRWYFDSSATSGGWNDVTSDSGYTTTNTDSGSNSWTSKLLIASPKSTGIFKCDWYASGISRNQAIELNNVLRITSQPSKPADFISGYSATYSVGIEGDTAFPRRDFVWYRNNDVLKSDLQSTATTSTANTGPVIYSSGRNNMYKVKVTYHGTYQSLTKDSTSVAIGIIDSCGVDYSTLNSQTTVNNNNHHVVNGVNIKTTCSKGYVLPTCVPGDQSMYTRSCTADTGMSFANCIGGNWVKDATSHTDYHYKMKDNTWLKNPSTTSSGYNNVQLGQTISLSCDHTQWTLRRDWSDKTTCNAASGSECTFDGLCVKGCDYKRNAYTDEQFTVYHGKDIIANQDSLDYDCVTNAVTKTGAGHYVETCNIANWDSTMNLNKCFLVTMAAPTASLHITGIALSWSHPTYPIVKPERYEITLSDKSSGATETHTTSGLTISFSGLTMTTSYTVVIRAFWKDSGRYTTSEYTYKTLTPAVIPTEGKVEAVSVDVPLANFYFKYYEVVVVYMSKDYIGSKNNLVYKYTNYNGAQQSWDNKRDTETIVWIYPSADAMYDSGTVIGAYIARYVQKESLSGVGWELDVQALHLKDDADYIITMRACQSNALECVYGATSEVSHSKDWGPAIVLGVFIPLFLILLILLILVCLKYCWSNRNKSMDPQDLRKDQDDVPMEGYTNHAHGDLA